MLVTELATTFQETITLVLQRISKIGPSQMKYLWSIIFHQRERGGVYSLLPLSSHWSELVWTSWTLPIVLRRQQLYLLLPSHSKSETSEGWVQLLRLGQTHTGSVGAEEAGCPTGKGSGVSRSKSLGQKGKYILERCVNWVGMILSWQNILFTAPWNP